MNDSLRAAKPKNAGSKADYAMGSTDRERQRLMLQGEILRGPLEAAFRSAGITSGMRVLDIGCGVGDVAVLAAEFVGPTGSVVALDRDQQALTGPSGERPKPVSPIFISTLWNSRTLATPHSSTPS